MLSCKGGEDDHDDPCDCCACPYGTFEGLSQWRSATRTVGMLGQGIFLNRGFKSIVSSRVLCLLSLLSRPASICMNRLVGPLALVLLLLSGCHRSTALSYSWAQTLGGTSSDGVSALTADKSGDVYVAGIYSSTSVTIGSTTLTGTSGGVFIAKLSGASGSVSWANG